MTIKIEAVNDVVVLILPPKGDHQQRFEGMSVREAHDHVNAVLQAIESASGFEHAMSGGVKNPSYCPNCGARNITPRHVCRRVRG